MSVKYKPERAMSMSRGKSGRKSQKPELCAGGNNEQNTLALKLMDQGKELTESTHVSEASRSSQKEGAQSTQSMANLETILGELRDFRCENSDTLRNSHLETILPDIIHQDQTGFIKQRQTEDNIRCILHVMQNIIKR